MATNRDYQARYLPHFDENKVVTGPYDSREDKRLCVCIRDIVTKQKSQQLYSRYLVEQHLGEYLNTEQNIDHWDRNKLNDSVSNLRIVSRSLNSSDDSKRVKLVEIACIYPGCKNTCIRSARDIRGNSAKGKAGPFCGKSCGAKYGREVQLGHIPRLPPQPKVESEYFYNEKEVGEPIPINEAFASALEAALSAPLEFTDAYLKKQRKAYLATLPPQEKKKVIRDKKERLFEKFEYWDSDYYGRSIHADKSGRKFIYLVLAADPSIKRHITYARFLMENVYKRRLHPVDETVDHINSICTDDRIENLQLMPLKDNVIKQQALRKEQGLPYVLPRKDK